MNQKHKNHRNRTRAFLPATLVLSTALGCSSGAEMSPAASVEQPLGTGPYYTNVTSQIPGLSGLLGFHVSSADVNGDGFPDLLVYPPGDTGASFTGYQLLLNRGGTKFEDVTAQSGIRASRRGTNDRRSSFGIFADVDNDGDLDLFSGVYGHDMPSYVDNGDHNDLLLNDGLGHFKLSTQSNFHLEKVWNSSGATFLDYDNDGYLDLFVGNWYDDQHQQGMGDQLYHNLRNGSFANVTVAMGMTTPGDRPRYGVTASDINNDGKVDLVASTYCYKPSIHWENRGNKFVSVGATSHLGDQVKLFTDENGYELAHTCSWGELPFDYDNDGDIDFFQLLVHGSEGYTRSGLLINNGNVFTSKPFWASLRVSDDSQEHDGDHHAALTDIDNDGLIDIVMTESAYGTNRVYVFAQRADHSFVEVTPTSGLANVGTSEKQPHNVIPFDFDRDGDEDLMIGFNSGHPIELWRNDMGNKGNKWIGIKLVGLGAPIGANRNGIGARVTITAGNQQFTREVGYTNGNFAPQHPNELVVGTGSNAATKVRVQWPNSNRSTIDYTVGANGYVTLAERPITCGGSTNGWQACRGTGCSVCSEKVSTDYALYYRNHPACTATTGCESQYSSCNSACPAPTDADRCGPGVSDNWKGCRGSGCSVCTNLLSGYPLYFKNNPGCTPNAACGGSAYDCSAACPAPTAKDRCSGSLGDWSGCRGDGCSVCTELVSAYPKYFANHPLCFKNTACGGSGYGACNANCPAPTAADK